MGHQGGDPRLIPWRRLGGDLALISETLSTPSSGDGGTPPGGEGREGKKNKRGKNRMQKRNGAKEERKKRRKEEQRRKEERRRKEEQGRKEGDGRLRGGGWQTAGGGSPFAYHRSSPSGPRAAPESARHLTITKDQQHLIYTFHLLRWDHLPPRLPRHPYRPSPHHHHLTGTTPPHLHHIPHGPPSSSQHPHHFHHRCIATHCHCCTQPSPRAEHLHSTSIQPSRPQHLSGSISPSSTRDRGHHFHLHR